MQIFHFSYKSNKKKAYLCGVFFIVLDLRLSRLGLQRQPFFVSSSPLCTPKTGCLSLKNTKNCTFLKKIEK